MSNKKKMIFRVGTGLAVTALALGTGCPKDRPGDGPNVNTVAPDEPVADPTPATNSAPATNAAPTNNGTNADTNSGTNAPAMVAPENPPKRVNTIPTKEPKVEE